jgi:hypothetical protein
MYTINTQLVYFKYGLDSKKLIVNLKWYKLDKFTKLNLQGLSFTRVEIDQFQGFIDQHVINFPGSCFVEQTNKEGFDFLLANNLSQSAFPYYFILSKNPKLNLSHSIYQAKMIVLMDKNYQYSTDYTLDFDVIGKVEIYKEVKTEL